MVIRKAAAGDADAFLKMQFELDKETAFMMYEPGERTADISAAREFIQRSDEGHDLLLVAADNENIAGYLSAQRGGPLRIRHTAYIIVGILKAYQGRGLGSELFTKLDVWAREHNITRLELTVMCTNTIARRLYEKHGFVIEGTRKNSMFVRGQYIDEYYMAKLIKKL